MQNSNERMIAAQARIISGLNAALKASQERHEWAEQNYDRIKLAAHFYVMLQSVIAENPILVSEWKRFLAFVKLADAQDKLQVPKVPEYIRLPPRAPEMPKLSLSFSERALLKKLVPDLAPILMSEIPPVTTQTEIATAIETKCRIMFSYQSQSDDVATTRVVEPYTLGVFRNGARMLIGRELSKDGVALANDGTSDIRSFVEEHIDDVQVVLTEGFKGPMLPPNPEHWQHIDATV